MVISDLHYDMRIFRGVDEDKAWEWLVSIVEYHKPDLLLSCGDWGTAINVEEFYGLLKRTVVLSIYGNHENMDVLSKLYNVLPSKYLPVLIEDGRVYEVYGLSIAGINGIISEKRRSRKGVPRKKPEEFLKIARELEGRGVDILLIHETPYLPELFPSMRDTVASKTALKTIEVIKPKVVFNGHMHYGGYKIHILPWGAKYIYIDSSQQNRHYAILYTNNMKLEIWNDTKIIHSESI